MDVPVIRTMLPEYSSTTTKCAGMAAFRQASIRNYFSLSPRSFKDMTNAALTEDASGISPSVSKSKKRKLPTDCAVESRKRLNDQAIDAGQRYIGPRACEICGFCGDLDVALDKKVHEDYHARFLHEKNEGQSEKFLLKLTNYTCARTLPAMPANFEVVPVHCSTANAALLEKARSVLKAAEQYSGATPTEHLSTPQHFAVLLLDVTRKSEKRIIGCVAAESVKRGQLDHVSIPDRDLPNDAIMDHELFYGIYVLWIAPTYRRKGFAVSLLDILRFKYNAECYKYGKVIEKSRLAFSEPTEAGKKFVMKYLAGAPLSTYRRSQ